jgi:hypothetical protein
MPRGSLPWAACSSSSARDCCGRRGASSNVGSGYWGHDITFDTTFYISEQEPAQNLFTTGKSTGKKAASVSAGRFSNKTSDQTLTIQWKLGQVLPFGERFQFNFILLARDLAFLFKYYDEYSAKARPEGRRIVFGGSWTFRNPRPAAAKLNKGLASNASLGVNNG